MIADWSDRLAAVGCLLIGSAAAYAWLRWCDR